MKPVALDRASSNTARSSLRFGFTLAELMLSLGICTVLMVSLGGSLTLALKSVDSSNSPAMSHSRTGEVADRVLADLTTAQSFSINTATDVQFKVPSRDGDAVPDTIRYQWTGSPSFQLLRSYNGGTLSLFAADVQEFNLSYLTRTMGPPPPPPPVESAEYLVMQHDDAPSGSFSDYSTSNNNWCAQYFNPPLSPDTIGFKVTRVEFRAKRDTGAAKDYLVQIRTADPLTMMPTTTVVSSLALQTGDLPNNYAWITADIPDAPDLSPEAGYCLVIAITQNASKYPKFQFEKDGTPMTPKTHWMTSSNAGGSWSTPESTKDMRFRIHGTVTTQPLP